MSSSSIPRGDRGFTLIEVMVALVLLAIGLLGLQALGINAATATAAAEKNSRAAATASQYMEAALRQIRFGQAATQRCQVIDGDLVSVVVSTAAPNATTRPRVTVVVTPRGSGSAAYQIDSYAFSPNPVPAPVGAPC